MIRGAICWVMIWLSLQLYEQPIGSKGREAITEEEIELEIESIGLKIESIPAEHKASSC